MNREKFLKIMSLLMTIIIMAFIFYNLYLKINDEIIIKDMHDKFEKVQVDEQMVVLA